MKGIAACRDCLRTQYPAPKLTGISATVPATYDSIGSSFTTRPLSTRLTTTSPRTVHAPMRTTEYRLVARRATGAIDTKTVGQRRHVVRGRDPVVAQLVAFDAVL